MEHGELRTRLSDNMEKMGEYFDVHLAITFASSLEGTLDEALLTKMQPLSREIRDRLFEGYGPLAGFAAKIDLAYALKIIHKRNYDTLRKVKKVRDIFAHRKRVSQLNDPQIAAILNTMDLDASFPSMKARYM